MKKIFALIMLIVMVGSLVVGCSKEDTTNSDNGTTGEKEFNYPERPVEVVIPFGEGGASDIFARKFTQIMSENTKEPIQPVNKSGAGGVAGMVYAAQQKNDGYSILEITPSHVIADVMDSSEVKLLKDFEPLARIQSDIYLLNVPKNSPYASFEDLLNSGKELSIAGISPGGLDDLTLNALSDDTGLNIKYIPYGSGSEVKAAVLGGEVDLYLDKVVSAIKYISDGSVKPVLVLNSERITQIPELAEVPCTVELGYETIIGSWRGFVVKKDTPQEIKDYLVAEMKKAYDSEEYKKFAAENYVDIRDGFLDTKQFEEDLNKQYLLFDNIATKLGLK